MKLIILFFLVSHRGFTQQKISMNELSWLTGTWKMETVGRTIEEVWSQVIYKKMYARTITKKNGTVVGKETVVIDQNNDGTIFYHAHPSNQKPASFKLVKIDSTSMIFENKEHDFPQRIIYRKLPHDSLDASIEGIMKGKMKKISFPYAKVMSDTI